MSLTLTEQAPDFSLTGVDGREHTLADYDDADYLALIQSCNHCPYVLAWEGRMMGIQSDYADRGLQIVTVNSNNAQTHPGDSFEAMVAHAAAEGFNYDYLYDPQQTLARALGSERTPEVFLFDRSRRLVYHGAIDDNRDETVVTRHYLREALDALLAGSPISISETPPVGCSVKWV